LHNASQRVKPASERHISCGFPVTEAAISQ
jgi:hypothetical protein